MGCQKVSILTDLIVYSMCVFHIYTTSLINLTICTTTHNAKLHVNATLKIQAFRLSPFLGDILAIAFGALFGTTLLLFTAYAYQQRKKYSE